MSHRIIKVQAFVVASTLSIAMLLFAAQRHESVATPQFRTVVDLTLPVNPDLQQNTLLFAPAKLGGAWTLDTLPPTRLTGPLVVIEAGRKNFAQSESLVTMDDVANYERLNGPVPQGAIVLVRSVDQSRMPTLDHDALHFLVEARNIVGIGGGGIQAVPEAENPYLAKQGIYELANLTNTSLLPRSGSIAIAAPEKIPGAAEGPVRLMALLK